MRGKWCTFAKNMKTEPSPTEIILLFSKRVRTAIGDSYRCGVCPTTVESPASDYRRGAIRTGLLLLDTAKTTIRLHAHNLYGKCMEFIYRLRWTRRKFVSRERACRAPKPFSSTCTRCSYRPGASRNTSLRRTIAGPAALPAAPVPISRLLRRACPFESSLRLADGSPGGHGDRSTTRRPRRRRTVQSFYEHRPTLPPSRSYLENDIVTRGRGRPCLPSAEKIKNQKKEKTSPNDRNEIFRRSENE